MIGENSNPNFQSRLLCLPCPVSLLHIKRVGTSKITVLVSGREFSTRKPDEGPIQLSSMTTDPTRGFAAGLDAGYTEIFQIEPEYWCDAVLSVRLIAEPADDPGRIIDQRGGM